MPRRRHAHWLIASGLVLFLGILVAIFGTALDNPEMRITGLLVGLGGFLGILAIKAFRRLKRHSRRHR